jgi:LacI family transcriptional regulator
VVVGTGPGRVTIDDVAQRAGVSIATVSRVVNGRYGVAPATVSRVQDAIDELGYESSLIARSLRSSQTNVIGILVSDIEPFSAELLKGVAVALRGSGYELVVYSGGGHGQDEGWERRSLSRLGGTLTDGIILVTPTVVDIVTGHPLVVVDPNRDGLVPTVTAQNLEGAIALTRHLIDLGHRRIAFIGGRPDLEAARRREAGFRQALDGAGIELDPELIQPGMFTQEGAERPARTLLTLPEPPTAVFAANDQSAIQTVRTAASLGLRVPEDVSVAGFDNIPESALIDPPLTTVDQSIQDLGRAAADLLLDLLRRLGTRAPADIEIEPEYITLPTELIIRQSTAPPAGLQAASRRA